MRIDPPLVIELPFVSPSQNETNRWHWSKKKKIREAVAWLVRAKMRERGLPDGYRVDRRMKVHVVRHAKRCLDYGNLVGGFKHCLDGLADAGILHDDSPKWVEEHYSQATPIRQYPMGGMTVVTVSELD